MKSDADFILKTGYRYMWHLFVSSSVNVGPAWSVGEGLLFVQ